MKLACQEGLLPGDTLLEKWEFAQRTGFDAVEVQAGSQAAFAQRLPDLIAARANGVTMPTICLAGGPFIGAFDREQRHVALSRMAFLLESAPEIGATGVITPAAWGIFSRRLPPHIPPRSEAEDRAVLLEGLSILGEIAEKAGTKLYFEPLNRYEDHMVNTLAQACGYCEEVGSKSLKVLGDFYHMNIEEANPVESLRASSPYLGHIHLSDSNRLEPGAGHFNFEATLEMLRRIGYTGFMAFEGRLSGESKQVLHKSVAFLQACL